MTTTDDVLPDAEPTRIPAPPPPGLGAAGSILWAEIAGKYDFRLDELRLLESACRTTDDLERLQAALSGQPVMVPGSQGQQRANPLFTEIRGHRTLLAKLLGQLGLPDDGDTLVTAKQARSDMGRKAAFARHNRGA